ncbi:hypothetical protein BHE74_00010278 [Ensete ventricosum]|nr:hypothetical protein BHE74_00010278 [Ensete ventricosum]RZS04206.1 hypothetical protein BHM03_00034495 [Ensete ventricosum]
MVPKSKGASRHMYLISETLDGGTKATQLAEAKLRSECLGMGQEDTEVGTLEEYVVVLPFELSAHIRLTEPSKSEDKVEYANVAPKEAKKNKIGVLKQVVKRSMAMPWYRRGGTFMESSIPSLMEGERLVMKRIEEMENTKANSKYRDKVKG